MTSTGKIVFHSFKKIATSGIVLVVEPAPETPLDQLQAGLKILKATWGGNE